MTNLLYERIDHGQGTNWGYGNRLGRTSFREAQYKGVADTIVQLIRRGTSSVIALSQPIRSDGYGLRSSAAKYVEKGW